MIPSGHQGPGRQRFTNLSEAAQAQASQEVCDMLARGHHVDEKDNDGNTALHWACWFNLDNLTPRLLERRACPSATNTSGETPVHWAAKSSNITALDSLTRGERSLLSMRDCDGFTPFIISAQMDNPPVMEWMFFKGVSVEEQDNWGRTALQWACYKGHRRSTQWLLSRGASVAHRDHEGTTALHWAALKGHTQVADMLLEVGSVFFIDVPDTNGDSPMALATRKRNRYLVVNFYKCMFLQYLIGRPVLHHNHFANFFLAFIGANILIFAGLIAPGIANLHPDAVIGWSVVTGMMLILWVQNCYADPGWIRPKTIHPQLHLIGQDPTATFDADQPVESQMAFHNSIAPDILACAGDDELARLEIEQNKLNYQRQLITQARKRLGDGAQRAGAALGQLGGGIFGSHATGETELQPLMESHAGVQLERAAIVLRDREGQEAEKVAIKRVERLCAEGGGEYLDLLDKGDFKQVCVVCRAKKRLRSHHCKECGRCVDRLDHHCPWIDNCVGLGNQRSFFIFIVFLFVVIVMFYYAALLYFCDVVIPLIQQGSFLGLLQSLFRGEWGPEIAALLVMAASVFNIIWFGFVGALVARHTAYMAVNITTYEVLVRPPHVQRRFPKNRGRLWFLNKFSFGDMIGRCLSFWTLDMERDDADFLVTGAPSNGRLTEMPA